MKSVEDVVLGQGMVDPAALPPHPLRFRTHGVGIYPHGRGGSEVLP